MKVIARPGDRISLKDAGDLRVVWVEGLSVTLEISGKEDMPLAVELFPSQQRGHKKNGKPRPPSPPSLPNRAANGANGNGRKVKHGTNRTHAGSR